MAAENEVNIRFGATINDVTSKLAEMNGRFGEFFKGFGAGVKSEINDKPAAAFKNFSENAAAAGNSFKTQFASVLTAGYAMEFLNFLAAVPGRMVGMVTSTINAADHLADLAQKTGVSAETLGGFGFAASMAGSTMDGAAAAMGKLNKTLAEAAAGGETAAAPFTAMGIEITDAAGKTKAADAVMIEVANHFATYKDGPEKAALALALFGKAGAEMIPMLNEGGAALLENTEYYLRYGGATTAVAGQSDKFNDSLGKLGLVATAFKRTLAAELLPTLQTVADEVLGASEKSEAFRAVSTLVTDVMKGLAVGAAWVAMQISSVGIILGDLKNKFVAFANGSDIKVFKALDEAAERDLASAKARFDSFYSSVYQKAGGGRGFVNNYGPEAAKPDAPQIPKTKEEKAEKAAKDNSHRLDSSRVALEKAEGEASLALTLEYSKQASAIYEGAYKDNLLTVRQYYDAKLAIEQSALAETRATKRRELDEASAAAGKSNKEEDRNKFLAIAAKLQGELNLLTAREGDAVRSNTAARVAAEQKLTDELGAITAGRDKAAADDAIASEKKELDQKRALMQVNAEAAFAAERQMEERSFAATMAFLAARAAAIHGTEVEAVKQRAALAAQTEAAERAHQQKLSDIDRAAELERSKYSLQAQKSVQAGFAGSIKGLLNGTLSIGGALRNFANTIRETFTNLAAQKLTEKLFDATGVGKLMDRMVGFVVNGISKMVESWVTGKAVEQTATVATEAVKTGAVVAGSAARTTTEVAASATSKSLTIGDAVMSIGAKAWQAAASVYAAIAAIPFVGPFLAPAAAVAAGAVVLGFASRIMSSEGGEYQVDQDRLNFVHKDETILPAPFARGLRNMIGEGGISPVMRSVQEIAQTINSDANQAVASTGQPTQDQASEVGKLVVRWMDGKERSGGEGGAPLAKLQALTSGAPVGGGMPWQQFADPFSGVRSIGRAAAAGAAGAPGAPGAPGSPGGAGAPGVPAAMVDGGMRWQLPANPLQRIQAGGSAALAGAAGAAGAAGSPGGAGAPGAAGGAGRGGDTYNTYLNLSSVDGADAKRFLLDNSRHVATAMESQVRNLRKPRT